MANELVSNRRVIFGLGFIEDFYSPLFGKEMRLNACFVYF